MAKVGARSSRWSLSGMTALVSGGTKGIGRATVEEFAEFGATIYTFSRTETELNAVLEVILIFHIKCHVNIFFFVSTYSK